MATLLVIAGLDPSAGAGLLADARVAGDHGVRAVGVATALTVQDTRGVRAVHPAEAAVVEAQIATLLADVAVDAVKIGMLGDERVAAAVARALAATEAPVVWDPVTAPSHGGVALLRGDRRPAAAALLPRARLVTPNLDEAGWLAGMPVSAVPAMRAAATAIRALGPRAVLVKGGHLVGRRAVDVLHDGDAVYELSAARVDVQDVHGTGCVLSSAIACQLAAGRPLRAAVREAKEYLTARLRATLTVGAGARCLV